MEKKCKLGKLLLEGAIPQGNFKGKGKKYLISCSTLRDLDGEEITARQAKDYFGISPSTFYHRIKKNEPIGWITLRGLKHEVKVVSIDD